MRLRELLTGSLVGILLATQACQLPPDSYKKKVGLEVKEKANVNVYEQSLREEYVGGKNNGPKNLWRVTNHTMNYLAKLKVNGINGSRVKDLLGQLDTLNVVYDSASIITIYNQIFADEDTKFGSSTNTFVSKELVKRAEQIASYGGFDINGRLNEWGKFMALQGLFKEPPSVGDGYVIATFRNGVSVKAVEKGSFDYVIEEVSQGPISSLDDIKSGFDDINTPGTSTDSKLASDMLKGKYSSEFSVLFDSIPLEVRDVRATRLPCYAGEPLEKERIIIDLYANRKGFSTKNSAGREILPFDLEYIVSENRRDSLFRVFSEKCHFDYDMTNEVGKGFTARVITVPFETNKNYKVEVKVSNGGKVEVKKPDVKMIRGEYPLEIVHKQQAASLIPGQQTKVPTFWIDPVSKNERIKIFFPVGGLDKDSSGFYSGRAFVSLVDPGKKSGRVITGKSERVQDTASTEPPELRYEDIKRRGIDKFDIDTLDIVSTSPNGVFIYDIVIPDFIWSGTKKIPLESRTMKTLALEFYTRDRGEGIVRYLGTAEKNIQIK
ncbi:MAG: hypothetical protein AABW51_05140 [Nanoarchaeota archaeon]